jgi:hypothetical protein
MRYAILLVFLASNLIGLTGCTPRVRVLPNPTVHDKGIRYYRPKPYLMVTSGVAEVTTSEKDKTVSTTTVPDPRYVNIQLVYLPDFEEEYAIDVRTGFGTADVSIKLEDGWNLTEISQNLDSQTDENMEAAASLIGALGSLPVPAGRQGEDASKRMMGPACTVKATNVPLGYYESVLGRDGAGRKRLYGFRYVGFLPYTNCPQVMQGAECGNCQTADLFGLVFEGDMMVFKRLGEIQEAVPCVESASTEQGDSAKVERTIDYTKDGVAKDAKITVTDKFEIKSTRDDVLYVPLPKIANPPVEDTPVQQGIGPEAIQGDEELPPIR